MRLPGEIRLDTLKPQENTSLLKHRAVRHGEAAAEKLFDALLKGADRTAGGGESAVKGCTFTSCFL